MVDLNKIGAGAIAGILAGLLILGPVARLSMRAVALIGGLTPEFTLGGSLAILLIGAIVGLLFGLLYMLVRPLLPLAELWRGVIYGCLLAMLVALPFFAAPGGELALATPLVGAALFAPITLVYAIVLAGLVAWRLGRAANRPLRRVSLAWFGLFLVAMGFAFARMMALTDQVRTPAALRGLMEALGVPFHGVRDLQTLISLVIVLAYCALCAVLFWEGYASRSTKTTSIAFLIFGGVVLNPATFGDNSIRTPGTQFEWTLFALLLLAAVVAISFALVRTRNSRDPQIRSQQRWLITAWSLFAAGFFLMWLVILLFPRLQLRGQSALQTELTVALYLWPWLLLLSILAFGTWRNSLPADGQSMEP